MLGTLQMGLYLTLQIPSKTWDTLEHGDVTATVGEATRTKDIFLFLHLNTHCFAETDMCAVTGFVVSICWFIRFSNYIFDYISQYFT